MAHKKAGSTAKTNKDSISKRLGVKKYGGESVNPGNIIIRQKGSAFFPGTGTKRGNDFTIFAQTAGRVEFIRRRGRRIVQVNG